MPPGHGKQKYPPGSVLGQIRARKAKKKERPPETMRGHAPPSETPASARSALASNSARFKDLEEDLRDYPYPHVKQPSSHPWRSTPRFQPPKAASQAVSYISPDTRSAQLLHDKDHPTSSFRSGRPDVRVEQSTVPFYDLPDTTNSKQAPVIGYSPRDPLLPDLHSSDQPGPGAYDPVIPSRRSSTGVAKCTSPRLPVRPATDGTVLDPFAYEQRLASERDSRTSSFKTGRPQDKPKSSSVPFYDLPDTNSKKAPAFGFSTRDEGLRELHDEDVPGPGAYDPTGRPQEKIQSSNVPYYDLPETNKKAPAIGFSTRDEVLRELHDEDVPGPGTYDAVLPAGVHAAGLPKSTVERLGSRSGPDATVVDPFAYEHLLAAQKDGRTSSFLAGRQEEKPRSSSMPYYDLPGTNRNKAPVFGLGTRDEGIRELHDEDVPGPGTYDPVRRSGVQSSGSPQSGLDTLRARPASNATVLDPFAYEQHLGTEKDRNTSSFLSGRRVEKPVASTVPFYDLPSTNSGKAPEVGRSTRDEEIRELHDEDVPGPGAYDAVDSSRVKTLGVSRSTAERLRATPANDTTYIDPMLPLHSNGGKMHLQPSSHGAANGTHLTQDVDFISLDIIDTKHQLHDNWVLRSVDSRMPKEREDEGGEFMAVFLSDFDRPAGNAAPTLSSRTDRFKETAADSGPITYLDDIIKPPKADHVDWMFRSPVFVPKEPAGDSGPGYYSLPVPQPTAITFGKDTRFKEELDPIPEPGPGAYTTGSDPLSSHRSIPLLSARRFEEPAANDVPYYDIPGLAEKSRAVSRQAAQAGLGFGLTALRFDEEASDSD
ncbi:H-SHIPPO 1 [Diplonema papillatum]|nr:H-SHIPPO 1 [Diplonema papillatum]